MRCACSEPLCLLSSGPRRRARAAKAGRCAQGLSVLPVDGGVYPTPDLSAGLVNGPILVTITDPHRHQALLPPGANSNRALQALPVEGVKQLREWTDACLSASPGNGLDLDSMPDLDAACRALLVMDFRKVRGRVLLEGPARARRLNACHLAGDRCCPGQHCLGAPRASPTFGVGRPAAWRRARKAQQGSSHPRGV